MTARWLCLPILFLLGLAGPQQVEKKLVPAGPYRVRVTTRRPVTIAPEQRLELGAGERRTQLRFEVKAGLELRGRVDRQAHGLTKAGSLTLRLLRRDRITQGATMLTIAAKKLVASDGSFAFKGLASGTYTITIETGIGGRYEHAGPIEIKKASLLNFELIPVAPK